MSKNKTVAVSPVNKRALMILKKQLGYRNADKAIWLLLHEYRPDLLRKAEKSLAIEEGE